MPAPVNRPRTLSSLVLCSLSILVCLCSAASGQSTHDAIVLEERWDIEIRSLSEAHVRYSKRTKLLTRLGARHRGSAAVYYSPGRTILSLDGSTRLPSGRNMRVRKRDILDTPALASYELYGDERRKVLRFPGAVPGSIVEYSYEMLVRNFIYLPGPFYFQDTVPIRKKHVTVSAPSSIPLHVSDRGKTPRHFVDEFDGIVTHRWRATKVPAFRFYRNAPPREDLFPAVSIEPTAMALGDHHVDLGTWDDVARFYHRLSSRRMEPDETITATARELTAGAADDGEKIRRIYEFARDKLNYVAIELGIGGWQPHPSTEVMKYRYGDCKDQATLMIAMLRSVGLDGYPVLIRTRNRGLLDRDHPSLSFNHAIVATPTADDSGYLFMDPTSERTPFGQLPWVDQGVSVLVVREDGSGDLVRTPMAPGGSNGRRMAIEAAVSPMGNLRGTLILELTGHRWADVADQMTGMVSEREKAAAELVTGLIPGIRLDEHEVRLPTTPGEPLRLEAGFSAPGYVTRAGPMEVISPHLVKLEALTSIASLKERSQPVFFPYLFEDSIETRITLPYGRRVRSVPEETTVDGPGLEAETSYSLIQEKGREVLIVRRGITVSAREVPASEYPALHEFAESLAEEEARAVTVVSGQAVSR